MLYQKWQTIKRSTECDMCHHKTVMPNKIIIWRRKNKQLKEPIPETQMVFVLMVLHPEPMLEPSSE
jgi:hypothetical protein